MFDLFGSLSSTMGVDLGTANTLIYTKENGIIVREPSLVARHKKRAGYWLLAAKPNRWKAGHRIFLKPSIPCVMGSLLISM